MKKILLVLAVVAVAGFGWTYKMKSEATYTLEELNSIASAANKALPVMVDDATRLERVVAHEGVLEKQYTLLTLRHADLNVVEFESKMFASLVTQSCANEQSRSLYSAGVSEWYTYSDMNGEIINTFKISKSSCSS